MTSHTDWDPDRYLRFGGERGRPYGELLARVPATDPGLVVDLGCGPGTLTALLRQRWPDAVVVGVDGSPAMLDRARHPHDPHGRQTQDPAPDHAGVRWELADLRDWAPERPVDVLVCNAALQWVPGHLDLLPRLVGHLSPGGWLALGVPGNFAEPSHALRRELAAEPAYAAHTAGVAQPDAHDPVVYLDHLSRLGCTVEAWETTYLHVLTGQDPVLAWIRTTGARPTLEALPDDLRGEFERELGRRLRAAYPRRHDGTTLLPFRRVFVVAQAPDQRDA